MALPLKNHLFLALAALSLGFLASGPACAQSLPSPAGGKTPMVIDDAELATALMNANAPLAAAMKTCTKINPKMAPADLQKMAADCMCKNFPAYKLAYNARRSALLLALPKHPEIKDKDIVVRSKDVPFLPVPAHEQKELNETQIKMQLGCK